jgi:hypothetical protein
MPETKRRLILKPGQRVLHRGGREATIVRYISPHNGYRVTFDERRQFEPDEVRIAAVDLTPLPKGGKLHADWESRWPAFMDKHRRWAR